MDCVKYNTQQHKTIKEKIQAQDNIGLVSSCLDYVEELSIYGEEIYWAEQPIETNTLRLSFENLYYDPDADGKSPGGTWTKIKTNIANIWDWHRADPNWYRENSFGYPTSWVNVEDKNAPDHMNEPIVISVEPKNNAVITERYKIITSDISEVTSMLAAFQYAIGLTEIWNLFDFSSCTTVQNMFYCCINLNKIPTDNWVLPVCTDCHNLFLCCTNLYGTMPFIDAPQNTTLYKAFMFNHKITKAKGFNCPLCTDIRDLFEGDVNLLEVETLGDTRNIKTWHDCFGGCVSLKTIPDTLDCSSGVDCKGIFSYCANLEVLPNLIFGNDVSDITTMFTCCQNLKNIPDNEIYHRQQNFSRFLSMNDNFWSYYHTLPAQIVDSKLEKLPDWKTENITNADYMFYGLKNVSKESVEEWYNFLKNSPTLVSHVGTFRKCAHNENIPDDWK